MFHIFFIPIYLYVLYFPHLFFCFKVQTGSPEPSVMDSLMTALQEHQRAVTFFFHMETF